MWTFQCSKHHGNVTVCSLKQVESLKKKRSTDSRTVPRPDNSEWRMTEGCFRPAFGARQMSGSFHCHPPHADCFLFTRNERGILDLPEESPLLTAVRCLESESQSGWFPYLWREAPAAGHTCALTAAPLFCMPGRENLVSSFNWTCHANGPAAAEGLGRSNRSAAQPHC